MTPTRLLSAAALVLCALAAGCGAGDGASSSSGGSGAGGSPVTQATASQSLAEQLRGENRASVWDQLVHAGAQTVTDVIPLLVCPEGLPTGTSTNLAVRLLKEKFETQMTDLCLLLAEIGPEAVPAVPALLVLLRDSPPGPARDAAAIALGHIGMTFEQAQVAIDTFRPMRHLTSSLAGIAIASAIGARQDGATLARPLNPRCDEGPVVFLTILATHMRTAGGPARVAQVLSTAPVELLTFRGDYERGLVDIDALMALTDPSCAAALATLAADAAAAGDGARAMALLDSLGGPAADAIVRRIESRPSWVSDNAKPPSHALWCRLAAESSDPALFVRVLREIPSFFEPHPALEPALVRLTLAGPNTASRVLDELPIACLDAETNLRLADAAVAGMVNGSLGSDAIDQFVTLCTSLGRDPVAAVRVLAGLPWRDRTPVFAVQRAEELVARLLGADFETGLDPARRAVQQALAALATAEASADRMLGLVAARAGAGAAETAAIAALLGDETRDVASRARAALIGIANASDGEAGRAAALAIAGTRHPQHGFRVKTELPFDEIRKIDRRWWPVIADACRSDLATLIGGDNSIIDDQQIGELAQYATAGPGNIAAAAARRMDARLAARELKPPPQAVIDAMATDPAALPATIAPHLLASAKRRISDNEWRQIDGAEPPMFKEGASLARILYGHIGDAEVKRAMMPLIKAKPALHHGILVPAAIEVVLSGAAPSAAELADIWKRVNSELPDSNAPLRHWGGALRLLAAADPKTTASLLHKFTAGKSAAEALAIVPALGPAAREFSSDLAALIKTAQPGSASQKDLVRMLFRIAPADRISAEAFLTAAPLQSSRGIARVSIAAGDEAMWQAYAPAILDEVARPGALPAAALETALSVIAAGWIAVPKDKMDAVLISACACAESRKQFGQRGYIGVIGARAVAGGAAPKVMDDALGQGAARELLTELAKLRRGSLVPYAEVLGRRAAALGRQAPDSKKLLRALDSAPAAAVFINAFITAGGNAAAISPDEWLSAALVAAEPSPVFAALADTAAQQMLTADPAPASTLATLLELMAPVVGPHPRAAAAAAELATRLRMPNARSGQLTLERALRLVLAYESNSEALRNAVLALGVAAKNPDPLDAHRRIVARWRPAVCEALLQAAGQMPDSEVARFTWTEVAPPALMAPESEGYRAAQFLRTVREPSNNVMRDVPSGRIADRLPNGLDAALREVMPQTGGSRRVGIALCAIGSEDPAVIAHLTTWAAIPDPGVAFGLAAALGSRDASRHAAAPYLVALAQLTDEAAGRAIANCRNEVLAGLGQKDAGAAPAAGKLRRSRILAVQLAGAYASFRLGH